MGYESMVVVVERTDLALELTSAESKRACEDVRQYFHANTVAVFKCGVFTEVADFFRGKPVTNCAFFFPGDGDTGVLQDMYGDHLREADPFELLKMLMCLDCDSRRLIPLRNLIGGFSHDEWPNVRVLHYGY